MVETGTRSESDTENAVRALRKAKRLRLGQLNQLSDFLRQESPVEWGDANRFFTFGRENFPNSVLVLENVSIRTVLKLYKMPEEDRCAMRAHLPDYMWKDDYRTELFNFAFNTIREVYKAQPRSRRRKAA